MPLRWEPRRLADHSLRTAAFSSVHLLFLLAVILAAMYASTWAMVASRSLSTGSAGKLGLRVLARLVRGSTHQREIEA